MEKRFKNRHVTQEITAENSSSLSRGQSRQSNPGLRAMGLSSGLFWHGPPAQPLNFSTLSFSHLVKAGRYSFPNTMGFLHNWGYCSSEAEAVTGKREVSQRRGYTCFLTAWLVSPETWPLSWPVLGWQPGDQYADLQPAPQLLWNSAG